LFKTLFIIGSLKSNRYLHFEPSLIWGNSLEDYMKIKLLNFASTY